MADLVGQALAALDMVFNAARLLSPLLLGSLYAYFAETGRPELLFTVAGVSTSLRLPGASSSRWTHRSARTQLTPAQSLCALGAALIAPLVFLRTPSLTAK